MIKVVGNARLPVDENYKILKNVIQKGKGKRICIVTGTHGDELEGQYVVYRLQERLKEYKDSFVGQVDIYPCLNPLGMDSIERKVPMFDLDMNRIFPGDDNGSLVEYMAHEIVEDLKGADLVIDIHASNIYLKEVMQIRINERQKGNLISLAKQMNVEYIWVHSASTVLESTLAYSLNELDTPTLVVEMGVGMRLTLEYGDQLVDGILHTMQYMGMIKGEEIAVREPIVSTDGHVYFLNAACSGIFVPLIEHDHMVKKDELIGKIINPLKGCVENKVISPCDGLLFTLREFPIVEEGSLIGRLLEI